jgi:hypothetical protein
MTPARCRYHTYSTYGRGLELLIGAYNYLDLTPLGRQEEQEEPPGRSKQHSWRGPVTTTDPCGSATRETDCRCGPGPGRPAIRACLDAGKKRSFDMSISRGLVRLRDRATV